MIERWAPVVGYEGVYEVSDRGNVRRVVQRRHYPAGSLLRPALKQGGYLQVTLGGNSDKKWHRVHRLVARAFLGEPPTPKHEVLHGNGDPADNRLENLRWGTSSENKFDTIRHGRGRWQKGVGNAISGDG